jgi:23S rRNA (guanosine2251-2'-O)-methyltransferase
MADKKGTEGGRQIIYGRNPVMEAISSGVEIERIFIQKDIEGAGRKIFALARSAGVPMSTVDRLALSREAGTTAHQGVVARVSEFAYSTVDGILEVAAARGEKPFIVLLDGIEDPHNLGAIIRSAEGAGAHGVVIRGNRASQITPVAIKSSAGAVAHMPIARVTSIAQTVEYLKERGLWVYGADTDGENYAALTYEGAAALVIGSEGLGVSRLVRQRCDFIVSIPMHGRIESLNASCAAAIVLYEMAKDR